MSVFRLAIQLRRRLEVAIVQLLTADRLLGTAVALAADRHNTTPLATSFPHLTALRSSSPTDWLAAPDRPAGVSEKETTMRKLTLAAALAAGALLATPRPASAQG